MVEPRSLSYSTDRWLTDSRVYSLIWLGRWLERAENIARAVNARARDRINRSNSAEGYQQQLAFAAVARGIVVDDPARMASTLIRDHPGSSIYHSMCVARSNATKVGSLELIRAITEVVVRLEAETAPLHMPAAAQELTAAVLEGLKAVFEIIDNNWFHEEPLSEEEVYMRFTQ